jgi:heat shock protein HslJ
MAMGAWSCIVSAEMVKCIILICAFIAALPDYAFPCLSGPEGIEWQLVEAAGAPVSLLAGEKQPYIRLDPEQKRATGFSGCNNFFSGYEINGSSLRFGLIGATRMACPAPETGVETEFFNVLKRARGWKINNGVLLLVDDGDILARFKMKRVEPARSLESMTFLSMWFPAGKVTLSHGEYREPAATGSASEKTVKLTGKSVFGFVGGRETGAVVLVTEPGGSGTFYDLALLMKEGKGWTNIDTVLLGDRVKVHSVEIENDDIVVSMTIHGPHDPMCCPTREVKRRFAVRGNRLFPVAGK